jgi:hypothetical protein
LGEAWEQSEGGIANGKWFKKTHVAAMLLIVCCRRTSNKKEVEKSSFPSIIPLFVIFQFKYYAPHTTAGTPLISLLTPFGSVAFRSNQYVAN